MRSLPLTVVASRSCSTSRTYLTYLKSAGYRPRKVLLVDFVGLVSGYTRAKRYFGERIAGHLLQWRRTTQVKRSESFQALCSLVQAEVPIPIDYFSDFDYAEHADEIERLVATSYDDPHLHRVLRKQCDRVYLYTDGGRVPASLLDDPDLRFLHIHPGVVPEVRGSDGLFWSLLARGRPGASCFYMNAGIDTGAIIMTREFARPVFRDLGRELERNSSEVYQALLYAYDPHLRAQLFIDVVKQAIDGDLSRLPSRQQEPSEGTPYYWMHPLLWKRVVAQLDAA